MVVLISPLVITLIDLMFPFPIRSISWHPNQHLLAIAMVGLGAAVAVYAGDKQTIDKPMERTAPTVDSGNNGISNIKSISAVNATKAEYKAVDAVSERSKLMGDDSSSDKQRAELSALIKSQKTR